MSTSKQCPECTQTKQLTEYYRAGAYYQSLCKICHNEKRNTYYVHIPKGFLKLPQETRENIIADLKAGIMKKRAIAKKHGLGYTTFMSWLRQGSIPLQ